VTETIVTGRDPRSGRSLRIGMEQGRITEIGPGPEDESAWITSGLIDLQVNGYRGHDLNAGGVSPSVVQALATSVRRLGVTTFLPTLITAPEASIVEALRAIAEARRSDPLVAHAIPYVHVEGPHLAPEDGPRGAHPAEHIRAPDLSEFQRWQEASGGIVGMVTLSPHFAEAPAYIRTLTTQGVHVAIGHTHASPAQITAAVDAGAVLSTHLGNGAAAVLPRHPNLIWTQLAEDRLTATFICDGHHLPADTFRAMIRAKGVERSILVSDTVALAGLPPGLYEQPVGGRVELTDEGRLGVDGTPFLAGAVRPLADDVPRAASFGGISLADALVMASSNPGRFVGGRGRLSMGAPADIVRFFWSPGETRLRIDQVYLNGEEA
jgi:N-acetylglucosamine-6-phosphate deacetylase